MNWSSGTANESTNEELHQHWASNVLEARLKMRGVSRLKYASNGGGPCIQEPKNEVALRPEMTSRCRFDLSDFRRNHSHLSLFAKMLNSESTLLGRQVSAAYGIAGGASCDS